MKIFKTLAVVAAAGLLLASCAKEGKLTRSGLNPDKFVTEFGGMTTGLYTLTNDNGMEVCVTNFGARLVSILVPDKEDNMVDVLLGFDNVKDYINVEGNNFGAVIGRYGNRIADCKFTLDEKEYTLLENNHGNCLHGGPDGWFHRPFAVDEVDATHIKLSIVSPDGDAGFPGTVKASITYTLTETNQLVLHYEAETDAPTVINMTNHAYFNLSGDPNNTILNHTLYIMGSKYTPVNENMIPTGEILPVEGTAFDFSRPIQISKVIDSDDPQIVIGKGIDHNWVLDSQDGSLSLASRLTCPKNGVIMDVYTTEPGLQVYSGNVLDGTNIGKNKIAYQRRTAICLETQHYPDSPNKADFPSTVLRPGEKYDTTTLFAFSVRK